MLLHVPHVPQQSMRGPKSMHTRMVRDGGTSAFLLLVGLAAAASGAAFVAQVRPTIAPFAIKVQYTNNRLACAARVFLTRKCTTRPLPKPRALTLIPKPAAYSPARNRATKWAGQFASARRRFCT